MSRCSRRIRNNISRWNLAFAGARIPPVISPALAGEARKDCGLGHAHGGGVARICGDPTAGPGQYLRDHNQHVPGKKGPTAMPTAAVVFALCAPVTLVQFAVENTEAAEIHGIQDHHLLVCEAVGIDPAWYEGAATGQNSRPRTTPP